jgi:hypothetical protein
VPLIVDASAMFAQADRPSVTSGRRAADQRALD